MRRVQRMQDGQQQIGVQLLSRNAQAVSIMREDYAETDLRITTRMPMDIGILLTDDPANQKEIEVLVGDATRYDEGSIHMTAGERVLLLQIQDVVEKNDTCARVSFTVVGIES